MDDNIQVIKVEAPRVDGGLLPLDNSVGRRILAALRSGRLSGDYFTGQQILDGLITDDWGCPPRYVQLTVQRSGREIDLFVPYDGTPSEVVERELNAALG